MDRRKFMQGVPAAVGATMLAANNAVASKPPSPPKTKLKGNIKQAITGWCFMNQGEKWKVEKFISVAKGLGLPAVELVPPEHWDKLKKAGLVCALTKTHPFMTGMNNKKHWKMCHQKLTDAIEVTSKAGFPNVISFTGFADTSGKLKGSKVSARQGMKNCIEGYKKIVGLAEKKKVTINLEPLNTRDPEPMKGHPGYQGAHIDYCMEIVKKVGSPNFKLLFDAYHIQIMDGDLIRRIHELKEYIGHVQIAGNPGRGEIGSRQEINYSAVMQAFVDAGYKGYVAHEWIPTGPAEKGLKEGVRICDV